MATSNRYMEYAAFDFLHINITRYDLFGDLIKKPSGYIFSSSLTDNAKETYVYANSFPDNGYASVQLKGVQYAIDRNTVQDHLCQDCLDTINGMCFADRPPAEFAIINFHDRTIHPLLNTYPWFSSGNYGINCEFKSNGDINLLIHYIKPRYT